LTDGNDGVEDGQDSVNHILRAGVRDSNLVQDLDEVVRDKTVATPLREETGSNTDEHAVAVTPGAEEFHP